MPTQRNPGASRSTSPDPVSLTVDVAILTIRAGRLSVLLVRRRSEPFAGAWALPGGAVAATEGLAAAASRRLAEETGLSGLPAGVHLEQVKTYGDPGREPRVRVVSVAYLGLLPDLPAPKADAEVARFWPVEDIGTPEGPVLAFDHDVIVSDAVERARAKLEYTTLATAFCEDLFTLADLRRVYEAAWGVALDAPNFRRKVLSAPGFVVPLGETAAPRGGGRPAELYRRGDAALLHPPMLRPAAD